MVQPLGDHFSITMLPEPETLFIVEKEPLSFAIINRIPTTLSTVLKDNDTIVIMDQKKILLEEGLFIHIDHIFLYDENTDNGQADCHKE